MKVSAQQVLKDKVIDQILDIRRSTVYGKQQGSGDTLRIKMTNAEIAKLPNNLPFKQQLEGVMASIAPDADKLKQVKALCDALPEVQRRLRR